eukprot:5046107-Amphidinium_carterae.1
MQKASGHPAPGGFQDRGPGRHWDNRMLPAVLGPGTSWSELSLHFLWGLTPLGVCLRVSFTRSLVCEVLCSTLEYLPRVHSGGWAILALKHWVGAWAWGKVANIALSGAWPRLWRVLQRGTSLSSLPAAQR